MKLVAVFILNFAEFMMPALLEEDGKGSGVESGI